MGRPFGKLRVGEQLHFEAAALTDAPFRESIGPLHGTAPCGSDSAEARRGHS